MQSFRITPQTSTNIDLCFVNFVTILLQQVCITVIGQSCDKTDISVNLVTSPNLVDNLGQVVRTQFVDDSLQDVRFLHDCVT